MQEVQSTKCPVCDFTIASNPDLEISELITCEDCGVSLEIKNLNPLELVEAPTAGEDWGE
jgi:lysine biosynthesis protein LysW